jgi:basic amino acid/polyamine antiporter, APA family
VLALNRAMPRTGTLSEAALLLLFAYAGFENTPAPAGEFKNPRRDVPFALIAQVVIVTLIYSAVQWVALGTLPGVAQSKTPLAEAARLFLGSWAGWLLTLGAVLSILGTNSNTVLAGPRYLYALAEDGFGPRALARLHPKFRTPAIAILTQTAIALPLALTGADLVQRGLALPPFLQGSFARLATLSVIARLATYLGTALAVPFLRRKYPNTPGVIRIPGGWTIPIAATVLCLVLLLSAETQNLIAGAVAITVGLFIAQDKRIRSLERRLAEIEPGGETRNRS